MADLQRMVRRRSGRLLAASLSGLLFALAQPNFGAWPLAFVCLVPLLLALPGRRLSERILLGAVAATVATTLGCVAQGGVALARYYDWPLATGLLASGAIGQLFGTGSFAVFVLLAGNGSEGPLGVTRTAGAFWTAELARCHAFTGLPWLLLAYAPTPVPELVQGAAWGGALFVSAVLAAFNAAIAAWLLRRKLGHATAAFAALALLVAPALAPSSDAGHLRVVDETLSPEPGAHRVAVLSLASPTRGRAATRLAATQRAALVEQGNGRSDAALVIWPENAQPLVMPANLSTLTDALPVEVPWLLLGAPRAEGDSRPRVYTSALILDPERRVRGAHDKTRLVPWSETTPWPFPPQGPLEMAAGGEPELLPSPLGELGALICYEVLFESIPRVQVDGGAGVLVNLSNEGWFGATGADHQLLAASVLRAVESRRPLLRSTNLGITAAIDARGRVVGRREPGDTEPLVVDVVPGSGRSAHVRFGHLASPVVAAATLLASLLAARGARSSGELP